MCLFSIIWDYFNPPNKNVLQKPQLPSQTEINPKNKRPIMTEQIVQNFAHVHAPKPPVIKNSTQLILPPLVPSIKQPVNGNQNKYKIQLPSLITTERNNQEISRAQLISSTQIPLIPALNTIQITIRLLNTSEKNVIVSADTTGQNLKKYIFDTLSKQLNAQNMTLYYQGVKVTKSMKLSSLRLVTGTKIKIVQQKLDIEDVPHAIRDANKQDQLTGQKGVAKMSCGHWIGRDSMTALIRSLISENKYQIRCPTPDQDNQPCLTVWPFKVCKTIGVFTKTEIIQFQTGLSQNWLKQNAKSCPSCHSSISRLGLTTSRVKCPSCKFGDFCYFCLDKWKASNSTFCGNDLCKNFNQIITNSPWNKQFEYKIKGIKTIFLTPRHRSCPHCREVIEHQKGCKHMPCKSCAKKFCWVCLAVPKDTIWPCGGPFQYCGKVAQVQRLNS